MKNMQKEYLNLLYENGFCNWRECTKEENEEFSKIKTKDLPINVLRNDINNNIHNWIEKQELSDDQLKIQISLKQTILLRTIKNCLLYLVVISIISIIVGLVIYSNIVNQF